MHGPRKRERKRKDVCLRTDVTHARAHAPSHAHTWQEECRNRGSPPDPSCARARWLSRRWPSTFRHRYLLASPASVRFWRIPAARIPDHARRFRALCGAARYLNARAGTDRIDKSVTDMLLSRTTRTRIYTCAGTGKEKTEESRRRARESERNRERERERERGERVTDDRDDWEEGEIRRQRWPGVLHTRGKSTRLYVRYVRRESNGKGTWGERPRWRSRRAREAPRFAQPRQISRGTREARDPPSVNIPCHRVTLNAESPECGRLVYSYDTPAPRASAGRDACSVHERHPRRTWWSRTRGRRVDSRG